MSYRDATLRDSTRRTQDARQVEVHSENRNPVATAKTMSLASQGATSSSPSSASASILRAEVPEEKEMHFGSFDVDDPASRYFKMSDTDAATGIDQESVEAEFGRQSKPGGVSRKEEAKLKNLEPLDLLDDEEIIRECLKKISMKTLILRQEKSKVDSVELFLLYIRQAFSEFRKTEEGRSLDARMKEVFRSRSDSKGEKTVPSIHTAKFTRVLLLVNFQADNPNLKAYFSDPEWREKWKFPKITNETVDYYWWEKNFDPEIVQTRLKIMEEVTKKVDPQREYFLICQIVSRLNAFFHPLVDYKTVTGMAKRKKFVFEGVDLAPTILSMVPGGS